MTVKNMLLFKKLIIANVLYGIPVAALTWLMIEAKNVNIDFAKQEKLGNLYQRPLEKVLEGLSGERILIQFGTQDPKYSKQVTEGMGELEKVNRDVGVALQFTDEGLQKRNRAHLKYETVLAKWNFYLADRNKKSLSENNELLKNLISDIRGMIAHAGDASNLILDPDLDSYYLMDVTLLAFPLNQDRIQEILATVGPKLVAGKISSTEQVEIAVQAALLKQSDWDRVTTDFSTVLTEDQNFYGVSEGLKNNFEPSLKVYSEKMAAFIGVLNKISIGEKVTNSELQRAGWEAMNASFESWDIAANELDVLLSKRVEVLTHNKWVSLAWALLALVIAGFILFSIAAIFNKNMMRVLHELRGAVMESRDAGEKMVSLSGSLSQATSEQAAAVHETASALDEINSMISSTVDNTKRANESAMKSHVSATQANDAMRNMLDAVNRIAESNAQIMGRVKDSGTEMSEINKIISQIGERTKIINDIVFQTKLLSFNASVEAARAGEHGKGFSVVAEEVGNLAKMSGDASDEIRKILTGSIERVDSIVNDTQSSVGGLVAEGNQRVEAGKRHAEMTTEVLHEIVLSSEEAKVIFEHITRASEEQAKGIEEITKAIQRLNQITQQNTDMASKTASYSEVLAKQANNLGNIVSIVEKEVLGSSRA